MEVISVCIEVTEAVTLFLSLLHARMKHVGLYIHWNIPSAHAHESSELQEKVATCIIEAHGLGAYYLDGVIFLQTLYASAPSFQHFVQNQVWPSPVSPVQLVCRRIGDYTSMTCYGVEGLHNSDKLIIKETVQSFPLPHLLTTSLAVTLLVNVRWKEIEAEMKRLSQHMHLLHVINPEVCYKLEVSSEQGKYSTEYKAEAFRSLSKTPFKLATSLDHYLQPEALPVRGNKLRLVKGETVVLPCCVAVNERSLPIDLQVSCAVALVPHSPLRGGRKVPADQSCTHINVHLFGPSMIPLLLSNTSHPGLPPSVLANWGQYRLALQTETRSFATAGTGALLVPGLQFKVIGSQNPSANRKQVLQLFVFFEEVRAGCDYVVGENKRWSYHMTLLRAMRTNLPSLLSVHSAKFYKAVHSALDKLICNYAFYTELRSRMERVVPCVAHAVSSIVQHSTSQQLKQKCRDLLQLKEEDTDEMIENILVNKLSELAKAKLDLGPENCSYLPSTSGSSLPSSSTEGMEAEAAPHYQQDEEGSDAEWTAVQSYSPDITGSSSLPSSSTEGMEAAPHYQQDEEGSDAEWAAVQSYSPNITAWDSGLISKDSPIDDTEFAEKHNSPPPHSHTLSVRGIVSTTTASATGSQDYTMSDSTTNTAMEGSQLPSDMDDSTVNEDSNTTELDDDLYFKDLESIDYDDTLLDVGDSAVCHLEGGGQEVSLGGEREATLPIAGKEYDLLENLAEQTILEEDFVWDSL